MPGIGLLMSFLEQATAKGTKSNVLRPLIQILVILIGATFASYYFHLPPFLLTLFEVSLCLTILLCLLTYIYCLLKDRDALRSESFVIQKLAIEKGFVGDNIVGLIKRGEIAGILETSATKKSEVKT